MTTSETGIELQECHSCGRRWQTSFAGCPYCGAVDLGTHRVAGDGEIYSWVEVHRSLESPPAPVPYTVVCVSLDAGARVFARWRSDAVPVPAQRVRQVATSNMVMFEPAG